MPDDLKVCTDCGFTWEEVLRKKRVGCPHCYDVFSAELQTALSKLPGNFGHNPPEPPWEEPEEAIEGKLPQLQEKLSRLIQQESFEEAARLRDEIKRLRQDGT